MLYAGEPIVGVGVLIPSAATSFAGSPYAECKCAGQKGGGDVFGPLWAGPPLAAKPMPSGGRFKSRIKMDWVALSPLAMRALPFRHPPFSFARGSDQYSRAKGLRYAYRALSRSCVCPSLSPIPRYCRGKGGRGRLQRPV